MKEKRIVNITHTDLDGIGCSIVLKSMFPKYKVESYYCGYHDVEQRISDILDNLDDGICAIYITDISFREDSGIAERIEEINKNKGDHFIKLFDHHATSAYLNKYDWAWSHEKDPDTGELKCGTQWTFELINKMYKNEHYPSIIDSLYEFVRLVNLWDTWRWVTDYPENEPHEEASWLNMIYSIKGKRKFFEDYTRKIKNNSPIIGPSEKELIECKLQEIDSDTERKDKELKVEEIVYITKRKHLKFIKDYLKSNHIEDKEYLTKLGYKKSFKVGVVFLDRNISDVGNKLAQNHPELDFIMIISLPKTISLRCVKDLDVPLGIMSNFITGKGGGHPKSAGATIKPDFVDDVISSFILNIYKYGN